LPHRQPGDLARKEEFMRQNQKERKKLPKSTVILLTIFIITAIVVSVIVFNQIQDMNSVDPTLPTDDNGGDIIIDNYEFLDNFNNIGDGWWASTNVKDLEKTNLDMLEISNEFMLGNVRGKLRIKPVDCSMPMMINGDIYMLKFKNNNCLFPMQFKNLDSKVHTESASLGVVVLTKGLQSFCSTIAIVDNPGDDCSTFPKMDWTVVPRVNENGDTAFALYYPIDDTYCLIFKLFDFYVPKNSANSPDVDDMKDLIRILTSTISVEKFAGGTTVAGSATLDDVNLDSNIIVHLKNAKIVNWDSGAGAILDKSFEKDVHLSIYNAKNKSILITEYDLKKDIDAHCAEMGWSKSEYTYNGKDMYVYRYDDDAEESLRGRYIGIMFNINDAWYSVCYTSRSFDEVADFDAWITEMIDGVLTISNPNKEG
jgi:hypothetical protein